VGAEKVHELTTTYSILSKTAASETDWFAHFGENGRKQTCCEILSSYTRREKGRERPHERKEQFWLQTMQLNELYFWTLSIVWCLKKIEE
jgi:hypothetical protein